VPDHRFERRAILIAAADHGVAAEGVSAYPPEVTAQMVAGFCAGTAAISAFARAARASVVVADLGVRIEPPPHPALLSLRIGAGTANLAAGPAMTRDQAERAVAAGIDAFARIQARESPQVLALGEMGIGNTTSAAALVAAFTGADPGLVVGRGTGIDDARFARKTAIVEAAVRRTDGMGAMAIAAELGGFEILALAGAAIAAAGARIAVVLDGFIVAAAALVARALAPEACDFFIASHRSLEPGHRIALRALQLEPLLDLDLRLGEASGAALALPLIEAAARMVAEMRTFAEAGVSGAAEPSPAP
jgi:nicotinate-nucleotide--dimethylbenzimidazole phosphoribosyltransferase